jgi:hypothetical protein
MTKREGINFTLNPPHTNTQYFRVVTSRFPQPVDLVIYQVTGIFFCLKIGIIHAISAR